MRGLEFKVAGGSELCVSIPREVSSYSKSPAQHRGYIGIVEKKMETTIWGLGSGSPYLGKLPYIALERESEVKGR